MTSDELRALADALEPMAKAPRFEDFDVPAFCAWVRAQAEAEPVAWIVEHGPTRRLTFFDEAPGKVGAGVSIPLYTHPAPAAPQAEPIDPHMIVADDRFPDAQAEPKRQPVSEATALIEWPESAKWKNRAAPEGIERSCMAEPKREPVGTLTIRDDMGAEITFHRSFTMRPSQTFAIYPNWDLLTHDIPTRGAFVVNAPKEIGNEFLPFHPAPAAPDGWKLVPVEPTREMIDAAAHHHEGEAYLPFSLYKSMLAAAPPVPQAEPSAAQIEDAAYERAMQVCDQLADELDNPEWSAIAERCAMRIGALAAKDQK